MKIVLQCWSSHDDTCGCDYALVDLTPQLARLVLRRIRVFRRLNAKDAGLSDLRWWNYEAVYFSPWGSDTSDAPAEKETERVEHALPALAKKGEEIMEVADDFALGDKMEARTECDRMTVREDGVSFSCIPKHTDVRVTTGTIPMELVERAAAGTGAGVGRRQRKRWRAA
jgi:hypothetical protein